MLGVWNFFLLLWVAFFLLVIFCLGCWLIFLFFDVLSNKMSTKVWRRRTFAFSTAIVSSSAIFFIFFLISHRESLSSKWLDFMYCRNGSFLLSSWQLQFVSISFRDLLPQFVLTFFWRMKKSWFVFLIFIVGHILFLNGPPFIVYFLTSCRKYSLCIFKCLKCL